MTNYYVHSHALCESENIGKGTRIWAFAHILPNVTIGEDCNICDGAFIESNVIIGDRVTVKCGVQLWEGVEVGNDVFIGPNATFTNDIFPRSKIYPEKFARTVIQNGASIGANATILPGITIGVNAMIGAGAVVVRSVPPNAIVVGNPAKIIGYVKTKNDRDSTPVESMQEPGVLQTSIPGVSRHVLRAIPDMRGSLSVGEFENDIPFKPKRYFLIYGVPTVETRGEHAHLNCHQFLIAVNGSVRVVADNGESREEFLLNRPNIGIYLPPMIWGIQYHYSSDAMLLVFASEYYDPDDYIRDYAQYMDLVKPKKKKGDPE